MNTIKLESIYDENFNNLKIVDLVDFKSEKVNPKIYKLQNYLNQHMHNFKLLNNALEIKIDKTVLNLFRDYASDIVPIYFTKSENISKTSTITNIVVKYDEDYSYNTFNEYNIDADTISTIQEYENINKCLSEQKDCSYIESYSYSIYLEISLKECA